jgi:hypothetical protein
MTPGGLRVQYLIPNLSPKHECLSIHLSLPLGPRHHAIPQNQRKQSLCRTEANCRPQAPLPNLLKKPSFSRMDFSTKLGPQIRLLSVQNFGVNTKFRHCLLNAECVVYSKFDMPILNGRIGKWILALSEFELRFESAKAIKVQIIADFVTEHHGSSNNLLEITPWALFFDGSSCGKGRGVGILLISPRGEMFEFAIPIQPTVTNNQAKY